MWEIVHSLAPIESAPTLKDAKKLAQQLSGTDKMDWVNINSGHWIGWDSNKKAYHLLNKKLTMRLIVKEFSEEE